MKVVDSHGRTCSRSMIQNRWKIRDIRHHSSSRKFKSKSRKTTKKITAKKALRRVSEAEIDDVDDDDDDDDD